MPTLSRLDATDVARTDSVSAGDRGLRSRVGFDGGDLFRGKLRVSVSLTECVPQLQHGIEVVPGAIGQKKMIGPNASSVIAMMADALVANCTDEQRVTHTVRSDILSVEPECSVPVEAIVGELPTSRRLLRHKLHETIGHRSVAHSLVRAQCSTSARHIVVVTTQPTRERRLTTKCAGRHGASLPEVAGGCKDP